MQTVTLPSGKKVHLRAVADITERQRRPLAKLRAKLASHREVAEIISKHESGKKLTKAEEAAIETQVAPLLDVIEELGDRLIVAAVAGWDYPFDVDYDHVLDIAAQDLDKLREIVAPIMGELFPDFSPTKDQDSPTGV
jgi:hypothetical protein